MEGELPGAARRPGAPVPRLVDTQGLPAKIGPVESFDGFERGLRLHLHESKTPRTTSFPVVDQTYAAHGPVLAKEFPHIVLGC